MLQRRTGLEVVLWDERMSTMAATRTLIEGEVRRENRKAYVDQLAAVFILQGYLDYIRLHPQDPAGMTLEDRHVKSGKSRIYTDGYR